MILNLPFILGDLDTAVPNQSTKFQYPWSEEKGQEARRMPGETKKALF